MTQPCGAPGRVTVPIVRSRKVRRGGAPLVMVTAYDAPGAKLAHRAGVDLVLVGDSLAMVVLGHEDTLSVTVEEMAHHTAAVARGLRASVAAGTAGHGAPLIVGDMPWMSYHVSAEDSVRNAAALVRAGAGCVKLEGGAKRAPMVRAIVDAEIPVMGHVGLTPQSVHATGGFKVQGRALDEARAIIADARALEAAGCFALVVEGVPDALAHAVTEAVEIPTIGIGAGPDCDGQVLVWHDLLGIEDRFVPKFVRRYADLATSSVAALSAYAADVRSGAFPGPDERYAARPELTAALADLDTGSVPAAAAPAAAVDPDGSELGFVDLAAAAAALSADAEAFLAGLYGAS